MAPNGRYLVVRPNVDGPVIAVNNCLHLRDLERMVPFSGNGRLSAEYSERYGGMMITL